MSASGQAATSVAPWLCGAYPQATRSVLQKIASLPVDREVKQSAQSTLEVMGRMADFLQGGATAPGRLSLPRSNDPCHRQPALDNLPYNCRMNDVAGGHKPRLTHRFYHVPASNTAVGHAILENI